MPGLHVLLELVTAEDGFVAIDVRLARERATDFTPVRERRQRLGLVGVEPFDKVRRKGSRTILRANGKKWVRCPR